MQSLDQEKFEQIARAAFERARQAPKDAHRWTNAINKAVQFITDSGLWHLMEDDVLLIVSPQSFEIYEVGPDSCERIDGDERRDCPAFAHGQPCWHRAARKLLINFYSE
jgi:hypothetical protein